MKSIALFNNKGGVGKTTTLCNIASFLARERGKRVLVVDADPQCNATIYITPSEQLEAIYSRGSSRTVYNVFDLPRKGRGYISAEHIPVVGNTAFGFDTIIGDTRMALLEDFLGGDWLNSTGGGERGLNTTFVFKDLLHKLSARYDYVFFDVGPSLGALNRCVLLCVDFFVIPMSSDIFSLKAVDNIATSLDKWQTQLERGLEEYKATNGEAYTSGDEAVAFRLSFLGFILQQYKARTHSGEKKPVKAYDRIISLMPQHICEKMRPFTRIEADEDALRLGEITALNSLVPLSQSAHKPIFCLEAADGVLGAHFARVREYKEQVIRPIVDRLEHNIAQHGLA